MDKYLDCDKSREGNVKMNLGCDEPINNPSTDVEELHNSNNERIDGTTLTWMRDYISDKGVSEEEDNVNLSLFTSIDPMHYEEANKHEKRREAKYADKIYKETTRMNLPIHLKVKK